MKTNIKDYLLFGDPKKLGLILFAWPFLWHWISGKSIDTVFWDEYFLLLFGSFIGGVYVAACHDMKRK